jgi:hypothetical protein
MGGTGNAWSSPTEEFIIRVMGPLDGEAIILTPESGVVLGRDQSVHLSGNVDILFVPPPPPTDPKGSVAPSYQWTFTYPTDENGEGFPDVTVWGNTTQFTKTFDVGEEASFDWVPSDTAGFYNPGTDECTEINEYGVLNLEAHYPHAPGVTVWPQSIVVGFRNPSYDPNAICDPEIVIGPHIPTGPIGPITTSTTTTLPIPQPPMTLTASIENPAEGSIIDRDQPVQLVGSATGGFGSPGPFTWVLRYPTNENGGPLGIGLVDLPEAYTIGEGATFSWIPSETEGLVFARPGAHHCAEADEYGVLELIVGSEDTLLPSARHEIVIGFRNLLFLPGPTCSGGITPPITTSTTSTITTTTAPWTVTTKPFPFP